jgi:large subunit ribosomal protein L25
MAEAVVLVAQKREGFGSHRAVKLRKQGRIPAVLYGHKQGTIALSVSHDELFSAIKHGARVLDLKAESGIETALIKAVQWDHLGKDILHADFERVSKDERITVSVRVELRGIAPGSTAGGVLDQPLHALEVECLAIAIPESIRVNIGELQLGQSIFVRDVKVAEGVKIVTDPDAIVVHVTSPQAEAEVAPIEGAAEPEVIGRTKAEEEEAEAKK